jgi:hypothetical protein
MALTKHVIGGLSRSSRRQNCKARVPSMVGICNAHNGYTRFTGRPKANSGALNLNPVVAIFIARSSEGFDEKSMLNWPPVCGASQRVSSVVRSVMCSPMARS